MNPENSRWTILLSYCFFAILLVLSFFFWRERAIAFDAAYQIFEVINKRDFAIQVERFGAAIVQFLPLMLLEIGASVDTVLQSYSASFVLYPILFFAIAAHGFKNIRMGFSIVLFFLLMQVHTFYWIQSELIQGCVFSLFFLCAFSKWPKPSLLGFLAYAVGVVIILYAHPLAIVALLFGMGYLFVDSKIYRRGSFWSLAVVLIGASLYKYYIASLGAYDTKAFSLFDGFEDRVGSIFSLTSTKFFLERLLTTYYLVPIGLLGISFFFLKHKEWLKLTWLFLGTLGWLVLILTTYHWGALSFYIESFYLMLGLFMAIPLAWDIWPKIENKWVVSILLSFLIVIRVTQIWGAKKVYQDRLAWTTGKLEAMNTFEGQRFYVFKEQTPMDLIRLEWAIPYEFLLLSSLKEQKGGVKTLYIMQDQDDEESIKKSRKGFPSVFGPIRNSDVRECFQMTDDLDVRLLE